MLPYRPLSPSRLVIGSSLVLALATAGCRRGGASSEDCMADAGPREVPDDMRAADVIDTYLDDLAAHPGCTVEGLPYEPAAIDGYSCAARAYDTSAEDPTLPIVILVHGNSDRPDVWESYSSDACDPRGVAQGTPMLAERLVERGFRVFAVDLRSDRVTDCADDNTTCNAAKNMDHGWGVPIAQHLIRSVIDAYPDRQISVVGHSYGVTVIRDALRRLYVNDDVDVWERVDDVVLLAGANHGVSSFPLCSTNPTRRGQVACEMGNRAAFRPTVFLDVLNGPDGAWETPCADGESAFGRSDACGGHSVSYTTVVMQDTDEGTQQDQFVSEASSALAGAENLTIGLGDFDQSDYFFCGLFKDHYGPARNAEALDLVMARLTD